MKKLICIGMLAFLFLIFPNTSYVSAEGVSAGISTWYSWWKFNDSDNMKVDPTLVLGPVISYRFTESWSLAGVFLYGKFKSDSGGDGGPTDINRLDSDISLNYNINRYFKIFGGIKLMGFWWDADGGIGSHMSAGPGLGIGTTIPLMESVYLLINISGTESYGRQLEPAYDTGASDTKIKLIETGANTNVSIAYYIAPASTSITLGVRYQYVYINYLGEDENINDEGMSFYGITLSAVYSF